MKIIDLRSDTVTLPTDLMRQAMMEAPLGDDVYGEDPTVNELELTGAKLLGKDAGLFLPSGTMGNLVALLAHTQPGDEVLIEQDAHIYYYEVGGMARVAGVMPRTIKGIRGHLNRNLIEEAVRPANIHFPRTTLICLENTHNRAGGTVMPLTDLKDIFHLAAEKGMKVHMDGARIFNASVALNCPVGEIVQYTDSVMFCISKGLAAPVGSLLVGTEEFIGRARKMRKMLGGGMRQAGLLAAAGLIALQDIEARLAADHRLAKELALGLSTMEGINIDPNDVETNIVVFKVDAHLGSAPAFVEKLAALGVKSNAFGPDTVRFVTHYHIEPDDIPLVLDAVSRGRAVSAGAGYCLV